MEPLDGASKSAGPSGFAALEAGCSPAQPGRKETATPPQVWEQQPGEPDALYAVFQEYLILGCKRSYPKLINVLRTKNASVRGVNYYQHYGQEWHWRERAAAWDAANTPLVEPREPWEQQPREPDRLYRVLQQYYTLGSKRSVSAAVRAQLAVDPTSATFFHCKRMAAFWNWRERAKAWDVAHPEAQSKAAVSEVEDRLPWEQQPGEKDRWYKVFRRYLALGPARNIHRAATLCVEEDPTSPDPTHVYGQALRWRWQERAEAWDLRAIDETEPLEDTTITAPPPKPSNPWDLQPGEPVRAYGFFCHFLELGPNRSINRAVREMNGSMYNSSSAFRNLARRWKWQQRAAAWDAHQRDLFTARVQDRRLAMLERRLDVSEVYFDEAVDAMETANLGGLDETQARRMLPTIHTILKDMATIQRTELEYAERQKATGDLKITGAVMDKALVQLKQYQAEMEEAEANAAAKAAAARAVLATPTRLAPSMGSRTLLVCIGPHPELTLDLAVLRAASGLEIHRPPILTRAELEAMLRRERSHGRPIELVHMAVHAGPEGIEFADGLVDGRWLSDRLMGVQVLMLSGCKTDNVGDWLRVVPYVVTLGDDITNGDAALLAEQFWKAIGAGQDPTQALAAALAKTPPMVKEFVTRHW